MESEGCLLSMLALAANEVDRDVDPIRLETFLLQRNFVGEIRAGPQFGQAD
jgi:hypothetical protein